MVSLLAQFCSVRFEGFCSDNHTEQQPQVATLASPLARQLSQYIDARSACFICYGSLIHALARLKKERLLNRLPEKIKIGQEFSGQKEEGTGIVACTAGLSYNLPGCPPKARETVRFLRRITSFCYILYSLRF